MMNRIRFALESLAFATAEGLAAILPRAALRGLGATLGALGGLIDRRHTAIAEDNLRRAYGDDLSAADRRRIVRGCWRHFGAVVMESLKFSGLTARDVESFVRVSGLEHARAAFEAGRGVLLVSGHFGHWELGALAIGFLGHPLSLVTRKLDNPDLERRLAGMRGASGNRIVHKRNAVREMMRAMRDGGGVAILIDQDARGDGIFVPFFGRPASTTPTVGMLAVRSGAAVVPVRCTPDGGGRYHLEFEPPVPVETGDDRAADIEAVTAACTAVLERWIREHPTYWLWMHRRWKTRPPADPASR